MSVLVGQVAAEKGDNEAVGPAGMPLAGAALSKHEWQIAVFWFNVKT